jgi:hypothetical protein
MHSILHCFYYKDSWKIRIKQWMNTAIDVP